MASNSYSGDWYLRGYYNFEEYLTRIGVGNPVRNGFLALDAAASKPVIAIKFEDNIWEIGTVSICKRGEVNTAVSSAVCKFQLGKEIIRFVDGRRVKSLFTLKDGALVERQLPLLLTECGSTVEYIVEDGGLLVVNYRSGMTIARRTFEKL